MNGGKNLFQKERSNFNYFYRMIIKIIKISNESSKKQCKKYIEYNNS